MSNVIWADLSLCLRVISFDGIRKTGGILHPFPNRQSNVYIWPGFPRFQFAVMIFRLRNFTYFKVLSSQFWCNSVSGFPYFVLTITFYKK